MIFFNVARLPFGPTPCCWTLVLAANLWGEHLHPQQVPQKTQYVTAVVSSAIIVFTAQRTPLYINLPLSSHSRSVPLVFDPNLLFPPHGLGHLWVRAWLPWNNVQTWMILSCSMPPLLNQCLSLFCICKVDRIVILTRNMTPTTLTHSPLR